MNLLSSLKASFGMAVLVGAMVSPCTAGGSVNPIPGDRLPGPKVNALALHDQMRIVYEDQILWTRMLALGVFNDLKGRDAYKDRLLYNYEACEDALTPYYDDGAGKLGALLEEHIRLTENVFVWIENGNSFAAVLPPWYDNGDEIASLMNELNPKYWPLKQATLFWRTYLDTTLEGALAHHNGDWDAEVTAYDALHVHALKLADFMSDGVLRQFPAPTPVGLPRLAE